MTSTVLARKYRPLSFEAMVGQGHVVQALANALTQQRLHHAYLFTGTRGVGKTTVSRILAKSLNCVGADGQGGITAHPCGQCQPCRDIDSGRFVDYVEMDAASNRGVEEISQLLDQAVYKPVVGRFKVYMIDEVHMLSNTAFNAMLKTLEEPPDYLKFVLATTDPQKVPVTVLSRCLQFNLRPMALQTVQEHLGQVLAQEQVPFEPGALRLLARAARGSMRDGLSLTDQAIAFGAGRLEEAVVRQMLGSVDRQHVVRLLEAVVAHDGPALIETVDMLRRQGLSATGTLDDLAAALQDIAVLHAVPGAVDGDDERARWVPLSQQLAPDECQLFYSLALHGRAELALSPDEYSGLLMILLRWLAFKPGQASPGAGDPKARGPAPERAAGPTAAPAANPSPALAPVATEAPKAQAPRPPAPAAAPAAARAPDESRASRASTPVVARPSAPSPVRPEMDDNRPEPPPWDEDLPSDEPSLQAFDDLPVKAATPAAAPALATGRTDVPVVPTTPLGDRWASVVSRLLEQGLITALVRELAMQAECVDVQDGPAGTLWRLRVERETLRGETQRERLTAALHKVLGGEVRLELEAGVARDSPALREQAARAGRQAAAEGLIQHDPLVTSLLAQFPGARVVPGSIAPL